MQLSLRVGLVAVLTLILFPTALSLILPGTGLISTRKGNSGNISPVEVVIFEHTPLGTGGLVLNQPTPIRLNDLGIARFLPFRNHSLMLGCGFEEGEEYSNVAVGEMAPWFWIHTCSALDKSFQLEGAAGLLYMGGNLDQASELIEQGGLEPWTFKFFYKYKQWESGELQSEIDGGKWTVRPQDPVEAIRPYSLPVFDS